MPARNVNTTVLGTLSFPMCASSGGLLFFCGSSRFWCYFFYSSSAKEIIFAMRVCCSSASSLGSWHDVIFGVFFSWEIRLSSLKSGLAPPNLRIYCRRFLRWLAIRLKIGGSWCHVWLCRARSYWNSTIPRDGALERLGECIPPIGRKGKLGMYKDFAAHQPYYSNSPRPTLKVSRKDLLLFSFWKILSLTQL